MCMAHAAVVLFGPLSPCFCFCVAAPGSSAFMTHHQVLMLTVATFASEDAFISVYLSAAIVMASLVLHVYLWPYAERLLNWLTAMVLGCVLGTQYLSLLYLVCATLVGAYYGGTPAAQWHHSAVPCRRLVSRLVFQKQILPPPPQKPAAAASAPGSFSTGCTGIIAPIPGRCIGNHHVSACKHPQRRRSQH